MSVPEGAPSDAGMTIVEVLVAIGLFTLVGTLLLSFSLAASDVTTKAVDITEDNGEARLLTERLTRELRQAHELSGAPVDVDQASSSLSFWTDFDGDGQVDTSGDPEVLTYSLVPGISGAPGSVLISDGQQEGIVATNVVDFSVALFSSHWEFDRDGDGATTGLEVDESGISVRDGHLDLEELAYIDLVKITLEVQGGADVPAQSYSTSVNLRNQT